MGNLFRNIQDPFHLLKFASVLSFVVGAFWISQVTQPLYHCHSSSQLFAIVNSHSEIEGGHWLRCEWWDYLLPRKRLSLDERNRVTSWNEQLDDLKRLEEILPPLQSSLLIVRDIKNPFAYQISPRQVRLGQESLKSSRLVFRSLLQAWISQVDRAGLDAFQVETLTDFLMIVTTDKPYYTNPVTGLKVSLGSQKFWPEEARAFEDYCLSPQVSLQHIGLCTSEAVQKNLKTSSKSGASLWSGRLVALSLVLQRWKQTNQREAWKSLTGLKNTLLRGHNDKGGSKSTLTASLNHEIRYLLNVLSLAPVGLETEKVTHVIDWKAGKLSSDFLSSPAFDVVKTLDDVRLWLRYEGKYWDLRTRRRIEFETSDVTIKHVVRVQCSSGSLDQLAMAAEQLTLIHHCESPTKDWDLLFQGQLKKFLELHHDLAYLMIRPRELHRYLKWNPQHKSTSWKLESWEDWMIQFGVKASERGSVTGVWDVIEELRLPYSGKGS